ncbi:MAG: ABC transporter permease [Planctomycetota bacterium]
MIQTWALLVDAYRELSSRKLFWLAIGISLLVVAAFACLGVNAKGFQVLQWTIDSNFFNSRTMPADRFYKYIFGAFGVPVWLAWGAVILALVSTGSMFPDLVTGGSIDLMLAKPISRLRLFLTKYVAGLLFTALQVSVFTVACFVVFGIRGGVWHPVIFWAIPIMVLFYSYLFSLCVLVGIVTRSALTSIIITIIVWFACFLLNTADSVVLTIRVQKEMAQERITATIERKEKAARETFAAANPPVEGQPPVEPTKEQLDIANPFLASSRKELDDEREWATTIRTIERIVTGVKTGLPKTSETVELLKRKFGDLLPNVGGADANEISDDGPFGPMTRKQQVEMQRRIQNALASRSTAWVLGTSLGFEFLMLSIAGWIFCRRDF